MVKIDPRRTQMLLALGVALGGRARRLPPADVVGLLIEQAYAQLREMGGVGADE